MTGAIAPVTTRFVTCGALSSGQLEVGGSGLAALHRHFVADFLAIIQALQSCRLHCGDMDEHVLAAVLRHDEAVALGCIEPLHGSNGHYRHSFRCASPVALVGMGEWRAARALGVRRA